MMRLLGPVGSVRRRVAWNVLRPLVADANGLRLRRRKPSLPVLVSRDDEMYDGLYARAYFQVGSDALHLVRQALLAAGADTPGRILDLPCGHGRVLRWLRAEWPSAEITACDLQRPAVDWCVATMGARGLYSQADLSCVDLSGPYDLIWVGSLFTHLDAPGWGPALAALSDALAPGGVLVFTTHGRQAREYMRVTSYGLPSEDLSRLVAAWERDGVGWAPYPWDDTYGVSLTLPTWVRGVVEQHTDLVESAFWLAGWAHHQDVFAYQMPASASPARTEGARAATTIRRRMREQASMPSPLGEAP